MKKKLSVVLSLMLLSAMFSNLTQISAITYDPGCEKGDYVKLDYTGNSTAMHNDTWIKFEVLNVDDANNNVTFKYTYYNGTDSSSNDTWINVKTSQVEFAFAFAFGLTIGTVPIIAGNLSKGDPLNSGTSRTINQTTDVNLGGKSYTVNKFKLNETSFLWHKKTGLLLKSHFVFINTLMEWQVTDENIKPEGGEGGGIIDQLVQTYYGLPLVAWIAIGVVFLIALVALIKSG